MTPDVPVLVPAFRRLGSLRVVLESLTASTNSKNPTKIVVAHDGPKSADDDLNRDCRAYLSTLELPGLEIIERPGNVGLSANIRSAVDELTARHGAVIVVEDDLSISPYFYDYMVQQLHHHRATEDVFSISAYSFARWGVGQVKTHRLPMVSSWGWATWDHSWDRFSPNDANEVLSRLSDDEPGLQHVFDVGGSYPYSDLLRAWDQGTVESWAVQWYASQFIANGHSIFPTRCFCTHQLVGEATNREHPPLAEQGRYSGPPPAPEVEPDSSGHARAVRASLRLRRVPRPMNLAAWTLSRRSARRAT